LQETAEKETKKPENELKYAKLTGEEKQTGNAAFISSYPT
jgi:hypothetical protein